MHARKAAQNDLCLGPHNPNLCIYTASFHSEYKIHIYVYTRFKEILGSFFVIILLVSLFINCRKVV